jgi:hypothetical protein
MTDLTGLPATPPRRAYNQRRTKREDEPAVVRTYVHTMEALGTSVHVRGVVESLTPIVAFASRITPTWSYSESGERVTATIQVETVSLDFGATAEAALEDPNANVLIATARKYSDSVRPVLVTVVKGGDAIARLVIQTKVLGEAARLVSAIRDAAFPPEVEEAHGAEV